MFRKTILFLLPLLAIASVVLLYHGYFVPQIDNLTFAGSILWVITVCFAVGAMLRYGTFRTTLWGRLSLLGIGAFILGLLFRIQHWEDSSGLVFGSFIWITAMYTFHFFRKQNIGYFDIMKLAYVILNFVSGIVALGRFQSNDTLDNICFGFNLLMIIVFCLREAQHKNEQTALRMAEIDEKDGHIFRYDDEV